MIETVTPGVPANLSIGQTVTVMPYMHCGKCTSCRSGRINACRNNQTLGVQQDGAFTEYIVSQWEKLVTTKGLGLRELAFVELLAVGFHAVVQGRVAREDTVLVFGCGMIGPGVIAAAGLHRKSRVIAVDLEDSKLAVAKMAGASYVINSRTENLHERLLALTDSDGPQVAIEAVRTPGTFVSAVEEVCFAGRVVYFGYAKAAVSYETKYFLMKELDIPGSRNSTKDDFAAVIAMFESGAYPVEDTVTQTVPFA